MNPSPTYHDVHVTTEKIPRTSIFDLPYGLMLIYTRVGGWELSEFDYATSEHRVIAGEYGAEGLLVDVDGVVIVDSLTRKTEANAIVGTGLSGRSAEHNGHAEESGTSQSASAG